MTIKKVSGALAALLLAAGAHASCFNVGTDYTCALNFGLTTDTIPVTLTGTSDLSFSGSTTSFFAAALGELTKGASTIAPFAFYETTAGNVTTLDHLSAGTYDFKIFGASFVPGAKLNLSYSISAIPEPQTYAMLLAGLAMMGAVFMRRRVKS
jgi:hypothetical protein